MFRQVKRRIPTQERGKRRVEAILEAAAEVFSESGFDGATMDAIAERAESSVGSIYQFFPNKMALFQAIAEACFAKSSDLFGEVLTPELLSQGWEAVIGGFLERYLAWERGDPYVRAIYTNLQLYEMYEDSDLAMMKELVDRTEEILGTFVQQPPKRRRRIATTLVNVATSFLFLARRETTQEAEALLEETKLLLIRYLRPYVEG